MTIIALIHYRYGDKWGERRGGFSTLFPKYNFTVDAGDAIDEVRGRYGLLVDQIQFISAKKVYPAVPTSADGGEAYDFQFPGCKMIYVSGSSGFFLDEVYIHSHCPDKP